MPRGSDVRFGATAAKPKLTTAAHLPRKGVRVAPRAFLPVILTYTSKNPGGWKQSYEAFNRNASDGNIAPLSSRTSTCTIGLNLRLLSYHNANLQSVGKTNLSQDGLNPAHILQSPFP